MNWKICSVEAGAGISKRCGKYARHSGDPLPLMWDAKTRVDDVSRRLL